MSDKEHDSAEIEKISALGAAIVGKVSEQRGKVSAELERMADEISAEHGDAIAASFEANMELFSKMLDYVRYAAEFMPNELSGSVARGMGDVCDTIEAVCMTTSIHLQYRDVDEEKFGEIARALNEKLAAARQLVKTQREEEVLMCRVPQSELAEMMRGGH